jgi:hypothetical protein
MAAGQEHEHAWRKAGTAWACTGCGEVVDVVQPANLRAEKRVQYVGGDDGENQVFAGHPGLIVDDGLWPFEVAVSFVNGPSICLRPAELAPLLDGEYIARGRRLVRGHHPVMDGAVPRFNAPGDEWPEGHDPG